MAFTPQTFTFEQVLTAAEMDQMDENIDEVRRHHKGSAPNNPEAGVMWLNDTGSPWVMNIYDSGSTVIELFQVDATNNIIRYDTGSIVLNLNQRIQYLDSGGTERTLIGHESSGSTPNVELATPKNFEFLNHLGQNLLTVVQSTGSVDGQLQAEAGSETRPGYSFLDDTQTGMYLEGADSIGFALANEVRTIIDSQATKVGKDALDVGSEGIALLHQTSGKGQGRFTCNSNHGLEVNRLTNDGKLIVFYKDSSEVGDISVSAGVVSLNGAALTRPSKFPVSHPPYPVRNGTVMAVSEERMIPTNGQVYMCSAPSDKEKESALYGVFDKYDSDNEFRVAFQGDFMVRVSGRVSPGDLLESNGDGTAGGKRMTLSAHPR